MDAITKIDEDQRLVFGFASVATIEDLQGDVIQPAVLEKAAYGFVANARAANHMHTGPIVGECIESLFITDEKAELLGISAEHVGKWWTGYHIPDDAAWENVKSGKTRAFSIEGTGKRVTV